MGLEKRSGRIRETLGKLGGLVELNGFWYFFWSVTRTLEEEGINKKWIKKKKKKENLEGKRI